MLHFCSASSRSCSKRPTESCSSCNRSDWTRFDVPVTRLESEQRSLVGVVTTCPAVELCFELLDASLVHQLLLHELLTHRERVSRTKWRTPEHAWFLRSSWWPISTALNQHHEESRIGKLLQSSTSLRFVSFSSSIIGGCPGRQSRTRLQHTQQHTAGGGDPGGLNTATRMRVFRSRSQSRQCLDYMTFISLPSWLGSEQCPWPPWV